MAGESDDRLVGDAVLVGPEHDAGLARGSLLDAGRSCSAVFLALSGFERRGERRVEGPRGHLQFLHPRVHLRLIGGGERGDAGDEGAGEGDVGVGAQLCQDVGQEGFEGAAHHAAVAHRVSCVLC